MPGHRPGIGVEHVGQAMMVADPQVGQKGTLEAGTASMDPLRMWPLRQTHAVSGWLGSGFFGTSDRT
jgi:hypothetical protein